MIMQTLFDVVKVETKELKTKKTGCWYRKYTFSLKNGTRIELTCFLPDGESCEILDR